MAHTITAHMVVRGAPDAADWYVRALRAEVGRRIPVPGGKFIEIELRFGDSSVMIVDEFPERGVLSPSPSGERTERCTSPPPTSTPCGSALSTPVPRCSTLWQTCSGGERHGQIIDPFGHRWGLNQHLRDVPDNEVARAAAELFGAGRSDLADAQKRVGCRKLGRGR